MKNNLFLMMAVALTTLCACGGDDDDNGDDPIATPTVTAPKVVSTTPANGATDVAIGTVNVLVVYDKAVNMSSDTSLQPTVSGTACTVVWEDAWGTNPHAPTQLSTNIKYTYRTQRVYEIKTASSRSTRAW